MFTLKLILRNVWRHKLRSTLTVVGVAVAIIAFGLLRTLVGLWYVGVESSSSTRLVSRNAISLIFPLPYAYAERIRQVPGVSEVSWGNWFGGIYVDEKNFFANFAVEPHSYLRLYPEFVLEPAERSAFLHDRKGAVAGRRLAAKYGWKIGDPIVLRGTIFPGQWEFILRGTYRGAHKNVDETQFFFHWDYLNETMKKTVPRRADQIGFFMLGVDSPGHAPQVAETIDATFKNSLAETLTETERAFQLGFVAMTEAIMIAISLVSYVVIVIIMVVAANTMAMTARERTAEYATLKTLGFGPGYVAVLIFGESLALAGSGGLLGIALTFPAARWIEIELGQFFPSFSVAPATLAGDVVAALTVGVVAAALPSWRGAKISVAEGLRRIG